MNKRFVNGINPDHVRQWGYSEASDCPRCDGSGVVGDLNPMAVLTCENCKGTGSVERRLFWCEYANGASFTALGDRAEQLGRNFKRLTIKEVL